MINNENIEISKTNKRLLIGALLAIILLSILTPLFLEYVIFRNDVKSVITNGQWSSFFGSFIGGIIGGVGTLIAVYVTTQHTHKIQSKTEAQINLDRYRDEQYKKKCFCDEISITISEYIADISKYFYNCRTNAGKYSKELDMISEIKKLNEEVNGLYEYLIENWDNEKKLIEINSKINIKKNIKSDIERDLNKLRRELDQFNVDRSISINCFYLLQIKLNGIDEADTLLSVLENIHKNSPKAKDLNFDWISNQTNILIEQSKIFIHNYLR